MVEEVVASGKSVTRHRPFAVLIRAKVRLGAMSMHTVGLPLMAKEASRGRESDANAGLDLAPEGPQVGVDILVVIAL